MQWLPICLIIPGPSVFAIFCGPLRREREGDEEYDFDKDVQHRNHCMCHGLFLARLFSASNCCGLRIIETAFEDLDLVISNLSWD
jgi:hypothetical protein